MQDAKAFLDQVPKDERECLRSNFTQDCIANILDNYELVPVAEARTFLDWMDHVTVTSILVTFELRSNIETLSPEASACMSHRFAHLDTTPLWLGWLDPKAQPSRSKDALPLDLSTEVMKAATLTCLPFVEAVGYAGMSVAAYKPLSCVFDDLSATGLTTLLNPKRDEAPMPVLLNALRTCDIVPADFGLGAPASEPTATAQPTQGSKPTPVYQPTVPPLPTAAPATAAPAATARPMPTPTATQVRATPLAQVQGPAATYIPPPTTTPPPRPKRTPLPAFNVKISVEITIRDGDASWEFSYVDRQNHPISGAGTFLDEVYLPTKSVALLVLASHQNKQHSIEAPGLFDRYGWPSAMLGNFRFRTGGPAEVIGHDETGHSIRFIVAPSDELEKKVGASVILP